MTLYANRLKYQTPTAEKALITTTKQSDTAAT